MSTINDKATVTLFVNGEQAQAAMERLEKKAADLEKQLQDANAAGDLKLANKIKRELDKVNRDLNRTETAMKGVGIVMDNLSGTTMTGLRNALRHLQKQLNASKPGSEAWKRYAGEIELVRKRIAELNEELAPQPSLWQRIKTFADDVWPVFDLISRGYDYMVNSLREYVDAFASMDQEMANVRKFTGMTEEQVASLNEQFKKIDTRTSREELNKLAQEAGRLGKTSEEDVLGFVRAADKINVALDDLGEGATLTLSKLTGIFGDEQRYGTEQALLKVGSVINELSQNCSASAPYFAEFAQRMGGVGAQAGMTIQQIMGFAAVLDSNAQALESSSTALQQVIVRLYQEPEKYAKVAGLNVKEFSELIRRDANGALILFLETLQKAGGMDTLSPMFQDMGENGSRAVAALSTLATHIDDVKRQQAAANTAFSEGTSIDKEFAVQNETVQASLEKCKNRANELRVELGEKLAPIMKYFLTTSSAIMRGLLIAVRYISENKTALISLTAAVVAYHIAVNIATIKMTAYNAIMKAVTVAELAQRVGMQLGAAVFALLSGNVTRATAAFKLFSQTLKANPIGLVVSLITAAVTAIASLIMKEKEAAEEEKRLAEERMKQQEEFHKSINSISQKTSEYADKEINNLKKLYKEATNETNAKNKRLEAAKQLQSLYPAYFSSLSTEQIMVGNGINQYNALAKAIIKSARARAAYEKIKENESKKIDLEMQLADLNDLNSELDDQLSTLDDKIFTQRTRLRHSNYDAGVRLRNLKSQYGTVLDKMYENDMTAAVTRDQIRDIDKTNSRLEAIAGDYDPATDPTLNDNKTLGDAYVSEKKTKAAAKEAAKEKRKQEAEARRAKMKAEKEFKDGLAAIEAAKAESDANTLAAYRTGQIDYLEFLDRNYENELKFFDDSLKYYEKHFENVKDIYLEDDKDYQELKLKRSKEEQRYADQYVAIGLEAVKRMQAIEERDAQHMYNVSQKSLADEIALRDRMIAIRTESLKKQMSLYKVGSKEYEQLRKQLEDVAKADQIDRLKLFYETVNELRNQYLHKSAAERFKIEMAALDLLLKKGKIKLEDCEKIKKAMREQYREELPGSNPDERWSETDQSQYEQDLKDLQDALSKKLISEEEYDKRVAQLEKERRDKQWGGLLDSENEWVKMLSNLYTCWQEFYDALGTDSETLLGKLSNLAAAASSIVLAGMQFSTEFAKANAEIELAAIEKKYNRETQLAQGNSYKIARLEKKKEEDTAKIKNEASKKEFSMKVFQAIAQSITGGLNAYVSTLAIPVVGPALAPAAMAVALATGAVQVALLKKQQQASEAQGYAEGGFTGKGGKYEPAGIVHRGEWVASQELLANPVARPMIEALDQAQRTNTIGSLRADDVSRSITANQSLVRMSETDNGSLVMAAVASQMAAAVANLTDRLNEPFVTLNSVTGRHGMNEAFDEYTRLMNNKSPKSRRNGSNYRRP